MSETVQRISTHDDPEAAARAAAKVLTETGASAPIKEIDGVPNTTVTLPAGLDYDGELLITAEVRELTGADEEALEKARVSNSLVRFLTTLLNRGVVRIGSKKATPDLLRGLLIGDRETLLLGIRKATYGNMVNGIRAICPGCGADVEINIDLDESVEVASLSTDRRLSIPLRKGKTALVRLPNGADQEAVLDDPERTVAEQNTILIQRCLLTINGQPMIGNPDVALKLGLVDRRSIIDALLSVKCGPLLAEVSVPHTDCGEVMPVPLNLMDLFRG